VSHCPDPFSAGLPPHDAALPEELSRLRPARPPAALRARVAAELARPLPAAAAPRGPGGPRWLAERLLWAAGGAVAASLVATMTGRPAPVAVAPTSPERPSAPWEDPVSAPLAASAPAATDGAVAEESLAWSDDGIQYLADGFPARIYRHWVVERRPDASGRENLVPREDVFVVPASLR
jgi:hypothetical protein